MTNDEKMIEAQLDGLLQVWHEWSRADSVGQGYPSVSTSCKHYRPELARYDDDTLDAQADAALGEAVDAQVQQIPDPWRTALAVNARNLATGRSVWRSARLPQDDTARAVIVLEARTKLMQRLYDAGLM